MKGIGEVYDMKKFGGTIALLGALSMRIKVEKFFIIYNNQATVSASIAVKPAFSTQSTNLFHNLVMSVKAEFRYVARILNY